MLGVYLPPALQHGCPTLRALIERAHAASAKAAAAKAASAHAVSAPASSAPEEEHRHRGASQGRAWQQGRLASLLGHGRSPHRAVSTERPARVPSPVPATVPPVPHGTAATRCGARRCAMLLSRGGGRRGAVLMQLAARDEQLLLEPLAHLFPYPAFCYLLSPCTADAEQRLTRGLQACLDGAYAFVGGRFSASRHAVIDQGATPA